MGGAKKESLLRDRRTYVPIKPSERLGNIIRNKAILEERSISDRVLKGKVGSRTGVDEILFRKYGYVLTLDKVIPAVGLSEELFAELVSKNILTPYFSLDKQYGVLYTTAQCKVLVDAVEKFFEFGEDPSEVAKGKYNDYVREHYPLHSFGVSGRYTG